MDRKDMKQGIIFICIVLPIILILIWINPTDENITLQEKIKITIYAGISLIALIISYNYQGKIDEGEVNNKGKLKEVFEVSNKASGLINKAQAIRWSIAGVGLILFGIYLLIADTNYLVLGIILIILGILTELIVVRTIWKLGGQRLKGRFY
jgi:Flp pilus assembly protein TadB